MNLGDLSIEEQVLIKGVWNYNFTSRKSQLGRIMT